MKLFSCVLSVVAILISAAAAQAAAPSPTTGGTASVTSTTAVLQGSVNPNNEATTYHFEYGPTTAYGSVTPDQGPTAATKKKTNVSAGISNLSSGTTYHYRLVATNASGTAFGADRAFTTGAGISLTASKRTITFGGQTVLSGQLTGGNVGGMKVTL